MSLDGVLFDMDGLLVDTEPLWMDVEAEVAAGLGAVWGLEQAKLIMGTSMRNGATIMRDFAGSDVPVGEIESRLVGGMLDRLANADISIQPGALELLCAVADADLPFALASASVRPMVDLVVDRLVQAGAPRFAFSVAGDEVERTKPDPLPYLRAAAGIGVDVTRCVVLEDSANGVRAGVASGAMVVAVPHAVPIEPGPRVMVRDSLVGLTVADLHALI